MLFVTTTRIFTDKGAAITIPQFFFFLVFNGCWQTNDKMVHYRHQLVGSVGSESFFTSSLLNAMISKTETAKGSANLYSPIRKSVLFILSKSETWYYCFIFCFFLVFHSSDVPLHLREPSSLWVTVILKYDFLWNIIFFKADKELCVMSYVHV